MSSPPSGVVSGPTIYGKVDFGPTFGQVYRPLNTKRFVSVYGGIVQVLPYDVVILIYAQDASPIVLQLPDIRQWMLYPFGGFDLTIKYFGETDLAVRPFAGQFVDGRGGDFIIAGSQGVGATILTPGANYADSLTWYSL